ncbi:MAG: hypothetical protein OXG51_16110, partial [Gammaproteobacteria bacterium]|nr:hypothetical protein [Gammaproteobacteria bacterium]
YDRTLTYIRTSDGFVTSMHDLAPSDANSHRIAFFNPGSNFRQESLLRIVNPGDGTASVSIRGVDDKGAAAPGGTVRLSIPPRAARTVTAAQLEDGAAGLTGRLGDGAGKWRLTVAAGLPVRVMSLLATPTGHLTNLSTAPGGAAPGDSPSDGRLPAPVILVTGDREFTVSWNWSAQAGETYAFDYGARLNGGAWQEDCDAVTYNATSEDTITVTYTSNADIPAGTLIEARYRYRNGSSCTSGSPGDWSEVGKHTVSGGGTQAPDLVVESASVDDNSPDTGDSFTLKATVRNRGDGRAGATTLRYYRSSNATISANDTAVGTDAVAGLAAFATSDESIRLTAPSSAGTYYYGACVDSVSGESSTANNCSDGVRVDVTSSGGGGGGGRDGECMEGGTYNPGEGCDVYGTGGSSSKQRFEVLSDGRGRFGFITSGGGIDNRNGTINVSGITLSQAIRAAASGRSMSTGRKPPTLPEQAVAAR